MFLSSRFVRLLIVRGRLSYGTGRPAILTDDESIWQCRQLLRHPLAIDDDMRLVSMVELMAIRERITNHLSPFSHGAVDERTFEIVRNAYAEFKHWYQTWDQAFSQKYEDAGMDLTDKCHAPNLPFRSAFYRQSLQIQQLHAELYHSATALRGINGPEDVQKMPASQREVAIKSIQITRQCLDITVKSDSYREGMKFGKFFECQTSGSESKKYSSCPLHPCYCYVCCIFPSSPRTVIVSTSSAPNFQ
jgi:hypothetical protein